MKKIEKLLKTRLLFAALMITGIAFGQKGIEDGSKYGQGEDSINCIRNISLFSEYVKQKNYVDAVKPWRSVYTECPASTKNIYIDGVNIYKALYNKELDMSKKDRYVDTIMMIFEKRKELGFGTLGEISQYQAINLYNLKGNDADALKKVYELYKVALAELGPRTMQPVFNMFIGIGGKLYNQTMLDADDLINDYLNLIEILEEKGDDAAINNSTNDMLDLGILNCAELVKIYSPKFAETPDNIKLLKNITKFMDKVNCEEEELYFSALKNLHKLEPSAESAKMLANMSLMKSSFDEAIAYAEEAVGKSNDSKEKGELYLTMAKAANKKNDKSSARSYAVKAASMNSSWGDPYMFIGSLYTESTTLCKEIGLPNAIYWIAVDQFVKAKQVDPGISELANKSIETYSKYFPNKEEAFFLGIKEGNTYKVECWINETTTARFNN